jgi:hypothetical protein
MTLHLWSNRLNSQRCKTYTLSRVSVGCSGENLVELLANTESELKHGSNLGGNDDGNQHSAR